MASAIRATRVGSRTTTTSGIMIRKVVGTFKVIRSGSQAALTRTQMWAAIRFDILISMDWLRHLPFPSPCQASAHFHCGDHQAHGYFRSGLALLAIPTSGTTAGHGNPGMRSALTDEAGHAGDAAASELKGKSVCPPPKLHAAQQCQGEFGPAQR